MTDDLLRSLLPTHGEGIDPVAMARRDLVKQLPARFYAEVGVEARDGLFALTLDGKQARTPKRTPLAHASREIVDAMATEWAAQCDVINPAAMPMTRLVTSALDGVAHDMDGTLAEAVKYAGSDMLCYRAGDPQSLVARQAAAWDPVLAWARDELGARFVLSQGVMFVEQPAKAIEAICGRVERLREPVAVAALASMTALTGSVLLSLAVWAGRLTPEAAWSAAHVDEDFQISQWGEDAEASERRARRWGEMQAAALALASARGEWRARED